MTEHDTTNEALEAESYPRKIFAEWHTFYDEEDDFEHTHIICDEHASCLAEKDQTKRLAVYQFVGMIEVENKTIEREVPSSLMADLERNDERLGE